MRHVLMKTPTGPTMVHEIRREKEKWKEKLGRAYPGRLGVGLISVQCVSGDMKYQQEVFWD